MSFSWPAILGARGTAEQATVDIGGIPGYATYLVTASELPGHHTWPVPGGMADMKAQAKWGTRKLSCCTKVTYPVIPPMSTRSIHAALGMVFYDFYCAH